MIKAWYHTLSLRYKALLVATIWILLMGWTLNLAKKFKTLRLQWKTVNSTLIEQSIWLGKETEIKNRLLDLLKKVDPQKTYDKTKFLGFVDEIARNSLKNFSLDVPQTKSGDIFDSHTLKLKAENAALPDLIQFEKAVADKHPYLSIEEMKITANTNNPHKLNAQFSLIAIQLKKLSNVQN